MASFSSVADFNTLVFQKGKTSYLRMLQGRRCILGKFIWWSAESQAAPRAWGDVLCPGCSSLVLPVQWEVGGSWGAQVAKPWRSQQTKPASCCSLPRWRDLCKTLRHPQGGKFSWRMFPQHPIFLSVSDEDEDEEEESKKRNRRIQKAWKASDCIILSYLTETAKSSSLGIIFPCLFDSVVQLLSAVVWTWIRHLSSSLCQQSRWEVLFQHFVPSGVTLGREMGLLACFS